MNKKLAYIIFIVLLICLIAYIVSLLLPASIMKELNNFRTVLLTLSVIINLVIALFFFDKYGLDKKLESKTEDSVLDLIDDLAQTLVSITYYDQTSTLRKSQNLFEKDITPSDVINKNTRNHTVYFNDDLVPYINQISIHAKNPWLPETIGAQLLKIEALSFIKKENTNDQFIFLSIDTEEEVDRESIKNKWVCKNDITIDEYFNLWFDVRKSIDKWVTSHSSIKIK